jgi:transcriptional antiterminator RfaH
MVVLETNSMTATESLFCDSVESDWFLLWTKSRQEKMVAAELAAREVMHYLPLMRQVRYHGGQKSAVELPLFPGYVFLRGSLDDAYAADRLGRIAQIISIADQSKVNWELRNLHFALSKNVTLSNYQQLQKGVRVEVKAGPLRGLQGVIESRAKRDRLILQVETLGRAVSLEVDGAMLDIID